MPKPQTYENCIVCGKPKQIPKHVVERGSSKRSSPKTYVARSEYERDPYCSRVCCEADQERKETSAA